MSDTFSSAMLALNSTAYWRFTEASGPAVADATGHGHNLTAAGTYTRNVKGSIPVSNDPGIQLDGVSGHLDADAGAHWNPANLTVVAFIRSGTTTGGNQRIVEVVNNDGGSDTYGLVVNSGGQITFSIALQVYTTLTGPIVMDGLDHMIVATWDGTNVKLYVDSVLYAKAAGTGPYAATSVTIPLRIGYFNGTFGQWFKGVIDEVAILPIALTQAQITALYAASARVPTTYYVSPTGNDANSGLAVSAPWQTISKINTLVPNPGDIIAFQGGATFNGNLVISTSGRPNAPVTITSYGAGKAIINGGDNIAILIQDAAYVTVTDIEAIGSGVATNGTTTSTNASVEVLTTAATVALVPGIVIDDVKVHDSLLGVHVTTATGVNIGTKGLRLNKIEAYRTQVNGISVNAQGGGQAAGAHVDVYCGFGHLHDIPGCSANSSRETGSGMVWNAVLHGVIEWMSIHDNGYYGHNFSPAGGSMAFYAAQCTDVVFQFSEIYNQHSAQDVGSDGGGLDWDDACIGCIFQFNKIQGCSGPGVVVVSPNGIGADNNCEIRYNLILDNDKAGLMGQVFVGNGGTVFFYGNTVYATTAMGVFGSTSGEDMRVYNNIFILTPAAGGRITQTTGGLNPTPSIKSNLKNNWYYNTSGSTTLVFESTTFADINGLRAVGGEIDVGTPLGGQGDPKLLAIGTNTVMTPTNPVTAFTAYDPIPGSPVIDRGINLSILPSGSGKFGGQMDFHGRPLLARGRLPIGAVQYPLMPVTTMTTTTSPEGITITQRPEKRNTRIVGGKIIVDGDAIAKSLTKS